MAYKKGVYVEPKDSIRNLLLKEGITYDKTRKGNCGGYMLIKDGVDLGYFDAGSAIDAFLPEEKLKIEKLKAKEKEKIHIVDGIQTTKCGKLLKYVNHTIDINLCTCKSCLK
jgi:hypothetical protein